MKTGIAILSAALATLIVGCGRPNASNIALRKENQQLKAEVEQLHRRHDADLAQLRAVESRGAGAATPMPSADQLYGLFTVAGLKLGRLTGPADLDASIEGTDGLKIYAAPIDAAGDTLKVAGAFLVEATDPDLTPEPLLGRWEFPLADAGKHWFGQALLNEYVLRCPWETKPAAKQARLKVTFTDGLTGRVIGPVEKKVALDE